MICAITKWLISWSLDSEAALPSFASRHAARCVTCGEFLLGSRLIGARLVRDGAVRARRPSYAGGEAAPVVPFNWFPGMAVSMACILLVGGLMAVHRANLPGDTGAGLSHLFPSGGVTDLLAMSGADSLAEGAEAGLRNEVDCLAQDATSAAKFLEGSLAFSMLP